MPSYVANTPESLVKRTDSKNPSTTCHGVTSSGRPCRRPLSSDGAPPPKKSKVRKPRVEDVRDSSLYCWQHKDQSAASAHSSPGPQKPTNGPILEERTSIDSLTGRLGLLSTGHRPEKPSRPNKPGPQADLKPPKPSGSSNSSAKVFSFCCFCIPLYFESPIATPRPHPSPVQVPGKTSSGRPSRPSNNLLSPSSQLHRPSLACSTPSENAQTSQYLSLIPSDALPDVASRLLAELAKSVSQQDEEGYVYIFWLSPESTFNATQTFNARSLLEPTDFDLDQRPRDVLRSFAAAADSLGTRSPAAIRSHVRSSGHDRKTILLKIGRANNVMRRMNEWKRQCGYDLSLVRFYPYVQSGSGVEPRKMPHSHKVERLIHLELRGLGLGVAERGPCEACGRGHKEWFEVEATQEAVLRVDEAIRRWTDWDEGTRTT